MHYSADNSKGKAQTPTKKTMNTPENAQRDFVESADLLNDWNMGGDGMPVKKGDIIVEEDGELKTIHADGAETRFI